MTVDKLASDAAYTASGVVALTGLSMQEWFGLVGLALAAATFVVNWYYKARADARAERLAQAQLDGE
tara:strand:- start:23783 stop:23983 length:201 start_codon:yes stop_codon:yes gene_type:complete